MTTQQQPVLVIEVPGRAVSANARLGYNRHTGRKFLTKAAREWKEQVTNWSLIARMNGPVHIRYHLPLRIVIHVYGTRADADNLSKLILDGLKEGIGIDDRFFRTVEMHATAKGLKEPRTVIQVFEAEQDEAA